MTEKTADLRDEIAEALMSWAERNANPQYASLRRPETVRQNAYSRADAVLAVLAARQTTGQPNCACGHPKERHLTCCTECPCIWYAATWPPADSGQQPKAATRQTTGQDDTTPPPAVNPACTTCKPAPAVGQPAEAQATDRPGIDHLTSDMLDQLYADLDEARMWARHGYEIGQRSCTWSDYGVAPAWLTGPAVLDQHGQTPKETT